MPIHRQFPRTHYEALVYFIARMDLNMVDTLLDPYKSADFDPHFLISLKSAFSVFEQEGDTFLKPFTGECRLCYPACPGQCFVGNNSGRYINLVFIEKDDHIIDLFECQDFENHFHPDSLNERILLNNEVSDPSDLF